MLAEPAVTIVIPAYNEEHAIVATIVAVEQALNSSEWNYEIIIVDDGSTDATAKLASVHGVEVVSLGANHGYGAALKAGIARGNSIGCPSSMPMAPIRPPPFRRSCSARKPMTWWWAHEPAATYRTRSRRAGQVAAAEVCRRSCRSGNPGFEFRPARHA